MALKASQDFASKGDAEPYEEIEAASSYQRIADEELLEEEGVEYISEFEDQDDLQPANNIDDVSNDSVDIISLVPQDTNEEQRIDSCRLGTEIEKNPEIDLSDGTKIEKNDESEDDLYNYNGVETVDCDEEKNDTLKESIFSFHTRDCNDIRREHTATQERIGKTYIVKKEPDIFKIQNEIAEEENSLDEACSSSDNYQEESTECEENIDCKLNKKCMEDATSLSSPTSISVFLFSIGFIVLLALHIQVYFLCTSSITMLKDMSDFRKHYVHPCLEGFHNLVWQNDCLVYAIGFGRPTYVPPRPPDEPDLPPPELNCITGNTDLPSTNTTLEYEGNENGLQRISIVHLHVHLDCNINEGNSSRNDEYIDDSPDDYISLRNNRQTSQDINHSEKSFQKYGNGSCEIQSAGWNSTTNTKHTNDRHGLSVLSNSSFVTNNRKRQDLHRSNSIDGTESTMLATGYEDRNEICQLNGGPDDDEFKDFPSNLIAYSIPSEEFGYSDSEARARTFRNSEWPHDFLSPEEMADAGLFYIGPGDETMCFYCKNCMYNWEPGDVPQDQHRRLYPDCNYIRQLSTFTPQPLMFPHGEQNRGNELRNETLFGNAYFEDNDMYSNNDAQDVYKPCLSQTRDPIAQRIRKSAHLKRNAQTGLRRPNSNLLNDRHFIRRNSYREYSHSVYSTGNRHHSDMRITRRYSESDTQQCEQNRRDTTKRNVFRRKQSISDPYLHNTVPAALESVDVDPQDGSNLANLHHTLSYDNWSSETHGISRNTVRRRQNSRTSQRQIDSDCRDTSRPQAHSENSIACFSIRNNDRNSDQTRRRIERTEQMNRIDGILDSNLGRTIIYQGYQRTDVARAIDLTLRDRGDENDDNKLYYAVVTMLSALNVRRRKKRRR